MVYFIADNIISPLGFTTAENFRAIEKGEVAIDIMHDHSMYPEPFPASMLSTKKLEEEFAKVSVADEFTRLEKMLILSVWEAVNKSGVDIQSEKTGIVLSTTKGNIDLLDPKKSQAFEETRIHLWKLGRIISKYFNNPNEPVVLSNACISGVLAINLAAGLIQQGNYDNVVVIGGDIVSRFVVSGFMSFMSLSPSACKPFDKNRDGLSLGEAASTLVLSKNKTGDNDIIFLGGGSANDANHISGPSRTGEGSFIAIKKALKESGVTANEIDHISAHGTATPYNDEMESIAIDRHGMNRVPVNSFKGNLGHTLGAAGLVETAVLLHEIRSNTLVKTAGFQKLGVSRAIRVVDQTVNKELNTCLKMASGFGGSNAALIVQKA